MNDHNRYGENYYDNDDDDVDNESVFFELHDRRRHDINNVNTIPPAIRNAAVIYRIVHHPCLM